MAFMRHNNNGGGGRRHHHNNRHRGPNNNHNSSSNPQNGQRRHVNRINQVFDSNGPDGRIRGTAQQIVEKFTSLARDAQAAGDKVLTQNYFQHAEHYQRLANEILEENAVFEREREAQRAATQSQQPDVNPNDATEGFAPNEQRAEQRPEPRHEQRAPAAAPVQSDEEDLNALPSFVQVPINAGAPQTGESPARPKGTLKPRRAAASPEEPAAE